MTNWISVKDGLPPVLESFKDGTNYHGVIEAWFPHYYKNNCRRVTLWSSDETEPRWVVSQAEELPKDPPTHWRSLHVTPPETHD